MKLQSSHRRQKSALKTLNEFPPVHQRRPKPQPSDLLLPNASPPVLVCGALSQHQPSPSGIKSSLHRQTSQLIPKLLNQLQNPLKAYFHTHREKSTQHSDMSDHLPSGNGDFPAVPSHGGQFIQYNIFGNLFEITNKYRPPIMPIGRGAYGIVCSMLNSETNEMVAIKKIANAFDNHMDAKRTLREIKLLRHLDHENVTAIRDVIPPPVRREFSDVYFAAELMDTDLHQIIRSNQGLSEEHCQYFLYQILRGLKYIHSANVIHRDLKPSNLLLNANCDLKICDFGLARPTAENELLTEYVVTRWYRAPELLLNSSDYTAAIDVWSVGCIFMELMNRKPLFPGKDHVNQMRLLTELLGTPTESDLGFVRNEDARRYIRQLPQFPRQQMVKLFPHVHPLAIDLVDRMLTFDPTKRITVEEALAHPYLERLHDVADEPICTVPFSFDFEQQPLGEEQMKDMIYREAIAFNPEYA